MTRVLLVAYHFPPIGGVGVQRALRYARYLPEHGIEPIVLTGPGVSTSGRWAPLDPTTLAEIDETAILRLPEPTRPAGRDFRERLHRISGMMDDDARWWVESIEAFQPPSGVEIDLILAEVAPYETSLAVERLAARLGVPWIADLRDPWALDEMWLYPTAAHRLFDRGRMRRTLSSAAAIVMNTPEARRRLLRAFPELRDRRVVSITNGFDQRDFEGVERSPGGETFRIVHTGNLHTNLGLHHRVRKRLRRLAGGMPVPEVDLLTRSHVYLLDAIDRVVTSDPAARGQIHVHLVGPTTAADHLVASGREDVTFHGFCSHEETISFLRNADLLFLPMQDLPPGIRAGLTPGKTYEYIASGSPILAAVPDGDARDIMLEIGTAEICRPAAVADMARIIADRLRRWRNGEPNPTPNAEVLERYEQRTLTADMADLVRAVAADPAPTGALPPRLSARTVTSASTGSYPESTDRAVPRWRRGVHRLTAPVAAPVAARRIHRLVQESRTSDEVVDLMFTFSYLGVDVVPLQIRTELAGLVEKVREIAPKVILEIGTARGGTFGALVWAAASDALIISVDLRHGEFGGGYPRWREPLYRAFAAPGQEIVLIKGDSHSEEVRRQVVDTLAGRIVDVLLIDGDHTFEGVRSDFEMYTPMVAPGGLVALHDIVPDNPALFSEERQCAGDVPRFWRQVAGRYRTEEIVENWEQGGFGIGLIWTPVSDVDPDPVPRPPSGHTGEE